MNKPTTQMITEALEVLNEAAKEQADDLGTLCATKYKELHKAVAAAEQGVVDGVRHGSRRLAELRNAATEEVKEAAESVNRQAHEHPWAAMAPAVLGALAVGFLLGRKTGLHRPDRDQARTDAQNTGGKHMNVPTTTGRVRSHTAAQVNRDILIQTECRIRYYAENPDEIDARLSELDQEWDVERVLEANASSVALGGIVLGITMGKKFLLLSAAVMAFLCQHAIQGWCPPLPVVRRLGVRTQTEIEYERYALKLLRGDFTETAKQGREAVDAVIASVRPAALT